MKRGIVTFLTLILFIIITFVGQQYYNASIVKTTFDEIFLINSSISEKLIDNFFSKDEKLKKDAQNKIKKIVLKDLGYENWLDYIDYIEIKIYPADVIDNEKEDLIIAINISKDLGVIGIYKKYNDIYVYVDKIENLAYINKINTLRYKPKNLIFIIVEEELEENIGAFFYDKYTRIFTKRNNSYEEVFRFSTNYEGYFYEKWTKPKLKKPKWFKLIEYGIIEQITDENLNLHIKASKIIQIFESEKTNIDSIPEKFILINEKNLDLDYFWSDKYKYFIQGEGITKNNEIVGIIESSDQFADYYLNLSNKYYKIIDKNGKIKYINSNNLKLLNLK
ncbi:hypothetical protein Y919_00865 [Caloranaerobacter azorensis H53214]|uniref:Uncharacterized protein n=1 Tax=Caloranaerobacter azorensis H53214 TaxID=1156417 RepID=A0A096BKF6_9FIRM|nr:hypothetical protein [Caloranaerobacter azorensis]KGG81337.1 hypothetical protein Y919_00865 [Caloranaerobacter azorensis H53214]